ncbi:MAG: NfeD family protein [Aggregatilineales bacterium]
MFDLTLIDPNIIFLVFVFGLWTGVTAAYVTGSGVLEFIALGTVGLSILVMTQMSTSWLAVMAIVIGICGFLITPFIKREYAPYALIGLGLQAIGGFFLFGAGGVSPLILALTTITPFAYYYFALIPLMDKMRETPSASRDELLVGKRGRVMMPLDPIGTVNVESEMWTAISEDEYAEAGREVIVVAREGLKLIVEPLKLKNDSHEFASHINSEHDELNTDTETPNGFNHQPLEQ